MVEEVVDLRWNEDGRRLVEDQDAGAPVQHLDDLDALALPHGQVFHQPVRIKRQAVAARELLDPLLRPSEVDGRSPDRLGPEYDILQNREIVRQHEVLVNHPDASGDGVLWRAEANLGAAHADGPLVGTLHPVEDLHERRLARAVLPDDGVDLARHHPESDAVVGHDSGKALCDPLELYGRDGFGHRLAPRMDRSGGHRPSDPPIPLLTLPRTWAAEP